MNISKKIVLIMFYLIINQTQVVFGMENSDLPQEPVTPTKSTVGRWKDNESSPITPQTRKSPRSKTSPYGESSLKRSPRLLEMSPGMSLSFNEVSFEDQISPEQSPVDGKKKRVIHKKLNDFVAGQKLPKISLINEFEKLEKKDKKRLMVGINESVEEDKKVLAASIQVLQAELAELNSKLVDGESVVDDELSKTLNKKTSWLPLFSGKTKRLFRRVNLLKLEIENLKEEEARLLAEIVQAKKKLEIQSAVLY